MDAKDDKEQVLTLQFSVLRLSTQSLTTAKQFLLPINLASRSLPKLSPPRPCIALVLNAVMSARAIVVVRDSVIAISVLSVQSVSLCT